MDETTSRGQGGPLPEGVRTLLVTGGGRGIGAAVAELAARRGYAVCVNYRRDAGSAQAVVRRIREAGGQAMAAAADVASEPDVMRLFGEIDAAWGRIDALVNNAGMLEKQMRLVDMDAARMRRILDANTVGTMLCAREAVRRMSTRLGGRGGAIVNVSSAAARWGSPGEYVDYAASKGAVDTFTVGLSREVGGEGIRVNAVRPGAIDTTMHADGGEPGRIARLAPGIPLGRGGTVDEVAGAVLWLLSDEAAYTTGSFIDIAGGK